MERYALLALDDALARWLEGIGPCAPVVLSPAQAVGLVLAEPLVAPSQVPGGAIARRAGYAVDSSATTGASAYSPVPVPHVPVLVAAGEKLPPGADAVLPPDAVARVGVRVEVVEEAAPGENACRPGEDMPAGFVIRSAGERVRGLDASLAVAAGISDVVVRVPRASLLGNSAVAPFVAQIVSAGAARISDAADADFLVVFTTGAAPAGSLGATEPLALRPGEGAFLWRLDEKPVLVLPGRCDDAMAAALVCLKPLLARLTAAAGTPEFVRGTLTRKIASRVVMAEITLLRRVAGGLEPIATGDLPLAAFASADAYLLIPPEAEGHRAGETVDAYLL